MIRSNNIRNKVIHKKPTTKIHNIFLPCNIKTIYVGNTLNQPTHSLASQLKRLEKFTMNQITVAKTYF